MKISVDLARDNNITTLDIFIYMIHGCVGVVPGRFRNIFTADMPHVMTDKQRQNDRYSNRPPFFIRKNKPDEYRGQAVKCRC